MPPEAFDGTVVHVGLIGPSLDILGGQSVHARRLYDGLRAHQIADQLPVTPHFLAVNPRATGLLGRLQRIKYLRTLITMALYLRALPAFVRSVDVVHAYSASYWSYLLAPFPALIIARLLGKPVLLNYHSGEASDHLARWPFSRWTMRHLAHRLVVPSAYLQQAFAAHGVQSDIVANSIDLPLLPYRRRVRLAPRILSNRNLEPMYNVGLILQAFARIQQQYPAAQLTVAGEGSQRARLEQLTHDLRLRNVTFVGRVDPGVMPELYDAADLYLNASNIDNAPLSILEAFACGVPVVSTRAGGIPFMVTDRKNGRLVPCNDAEALGVAALGLLTEPALALQLADQARTDCVTQHGWDRVADRWRHIYHDLAFGRQVPTGQIVDTRSPFPGK